MSAELIIWKDAVTNSNLQELGKAYKLFSGCKHLVVTKNENKRAVVMFKNDKEQVSTVITSKVVNQLLRSGKISKVQLLELNVLRGKHEGSGEDAMWLSLPSNGWSDMGAVKETTNWEELSL